MGRAIETPARARNGLVATMERHSPNQGARDGRPRGAKNSATRSRQPASVIGFHQQPCHQLGSILKSFLIICRRIRGDLVGRRGSVLIKTGTAKGCADLDRARIGGVGAGDRDCAEDFAGPCRRSVPSSKGLSAARSRFCSRSVLVISKVEAAKWQKFIPRRFRPARARRGKALALVAVS